MRLGCIDIGSNTTRLLVGERREGELRRLHEERAFTGIGRDLRAYGRISQEKIAAVAEVVAGQLASAQRQGAGSVRAVATAAVREAPNRERLVEAVRAACGLEVEVLSTSEEARLAFVGATGTLPEPARGRRVGVADVGGGSTELVVGTAGEEVEWWRSLPIGSALLREGAHDPPTAEELEGLRELVSCALAEARPPLPEQAVAVGGSATSLTRLCGPVLRPAALDAALRRLRAAPAAELAPQLELHPERVALLPAGLVILRGVAEVFGQPLEVGRGGMREGVLLEWAER